MNGIIFDIQRFSIFDGPGIRTNVFFKGCNLKCLWCHNPESQSKSNQLMLYRSKCIGCKKCEAFCKKAFTSECTACGKCVEICPESARKITGKIMTADEVVEEVIKDKAFYETSGGGVTLSGGEPLLQSDFAAEILKKCKEKNIGTAIETAANVPWKSFQKVLPFLDNILCDIKCIDKDLHKKLTGVSNRLILENAEKLKSENKNLIFRMPVIPTLNESEIEKVKNFAGNTPLEILAYHNTGKEKYYSLGVKYDIENVVPPSAEHMKEIAKKYDCIYTPSGL
ncbi:MAG: glycyl-radical enzyme activating protein [Clostridia bacterium]|nr:glycyl-radical enzyme activating protein [Clostridia bacterium]